MAFPPRLLVSVRNVAEARIALDAGVDILDVKEPARGSLGRAEKTTIREIVRLVRGHHRRVPVSVACGEVGDFPGSDSMPTAGVEFLKLGLAGLRHRDAWISDWQHTKSQISCAGDASPACAWIAVAYVDEVQAQAPPVGEVLAAAIETKSAGLLFDTFEKNGLGLFDYISLKKLRSLIIEAHQAGLPCAIAGGLQLAGLDRLSGLDADIVAVRTAACVGQDRQAAIDAQAIRNLRRALYAQGTSLDIS